MNSNNGYFAESIAAARTQDIISKMNKFVNDFKELEKTWGNEILNYASSAANNAILAGCIAGAAGILAACASGVVAGGYGSEMSEVNEASRTAEGELNALKPGLNNIDTGIKNANTRIEEINTRIKDVDLELNGNRVVLNPNGQQPVQNNLNQLTPERRIELSNEKANLLGEKEGLVQQRDGLVEERKPIMEKEKESDVKLQEKLKISDVKANRKMMLGQLAQGITKDGLGQAGQGYYNATSQQQSAMKDISNNNFGQTQSAENESQGVVKTVLGMNSYSASVAASR